MGILTNGTTVTEELTDGDHGESGILADILKLMRDPNQPGWATEFIRHLGWLGKGSHECTLERVVSAAIQNFHNNQSEECHGILAGDQIDLTIVSDYESKQLLEYLKVQRSENWLGGFISCLCLCFVEHGRRPTPLDVIKGLAGDEVSVFDMNIETTRKMLTDYSGLFTEDLLALQKATAPAVPPAATTPAAEPSPPRRRK